MKKLLFVLLLPIILFFTSGCYTQFATYETTVSVPDSTTVNITNTYNIDYVGYGYRYPDLSWNYGYQPYWFDGYYSPGYYPYRAYIYPFRPFGHRPFIVPRTPVWRFPFHYNPPRHFGNNWQIVKPTDPPKHGREIGNQPPRKFEFQTPPRSRGVFRSETTRRYEQQRVQMPSPPAYRDSRQSFSQPSGNTYHPPASSTPPQNSGGTRSSGAHRTGR